MFCNTASGSGKTRAAQTKSKLVQMFVGDSAKLVRDAFALSREKPLAIIFMDELDDIGIKRFDSENAGDREVQRTMLEFNLINSKQKCIYTHL